jgi:hypothetical protein
MLVNGRVIYALLVSARTSILLGCLFLYVLNLLSFRVCANALFSISSVFILIVFVIPSLNQSKS